MCNVEEKQMLEEYTQLRQDIVFSYTRIENTLFITIAAVGTIFTFVLASKMALIVLLILPCFIALISWRADAIYDHILKIRSYIEVILEPKMKGVTYETLRSSGENIKKRNSDPVERFMCLSRCPGVWYLFLILIIVGFFYALKSYNEEDFRDFPETVIPIMVFRENSSMESYKKAAMDYYYSAKWLRDTIKEPQDRLIAVLSDEVSALSVEVSYYIKHIEASKIRLNELSADLEKEERNDRKYSWDQRVADLHEKTKENLKSSIRNEELILKEYESQLERKRGLHDEKTVVLGNSRKISEDMVNNMIVEISISVFSGVLCLWFAVRNTFLLKKRHARWQNAWRTAETLEQEEQLLCESKTAG